MKEEINVNGQVAIRLEDVAFQYPSSEKLSIKNINLSVRSGEFVVLTGGSGCGKTTITRIVNGLAEKFYEGKLTGNTEIFGTSISKYPLYEIGKIVGSIFQDPKSQFFASVTEDEIAFGCENYGIAGEELDTRVSEALQRINGDMLRGKEIYSMSSGEKQKIAVASVHAVNPKIYVFDEPSANLDMYSVKILKELMRKLKAEGHTVLVAEHRLYYLTHLADRFLYMKDGEIQKEWSPKELLALPEDERKIIGIRAADLKQVKIETTKSEKQKEALVVKDLSFYYGKHSIFKNISFQACIGDLIAVVGHNGVGKTTLSNILCGIQKEKKGKILYNGKELLPRKRRKAAYFVMQNTDCQLFGDSVLEELRLNKKNADESEMDELLKLYDLYELKKHHPATLSGGQKQRLTVAVSDWIDTPILILDEPTSGLDFQNMQRISQHLRTLAHAGKTIFVITHDYEFAAMTCNKVLCIGGYNQIDMFPLRKNEAKFYSSLMSQ
jgi:energy-coupling factor transport system ATP-binding protein